MLDQYIQRFHLHFHFLPWWYCFAIVSQMVDDTEKLKKHLSMALDRISKGARVIRPALKGGSSNCAKNNAVEIDDGDDDT